jgi:hypothetical protein
MAAGAGRAYARAVTGGIVRFIQQLDGKWLTGRVCKAKAASIARSHSKQTTCPASDS